MLVRKKLTMKFMGISLKDSVKGVLKKFFLPGTCFEIFKNKKLTGV